MLPSESTVLYCFRVIHKSCVSEKPAIFLHRVHLEKMVTLVLRVPLDLL